MGEVALPPNLERERWADTQIAFAKAFTAQLKQLDERLELVFINEQAKAPGLLPGRWHVRRRNPELGFDSYIPIAGPNGEYVEPHSGVIEELRQRDLWRENVSTKLIRERMAREARAEADKALRDEQTRDHIAQDYRAARRVVGETLDRRNWGKK